MPPPAGNPTSTSAHPRGSCCGRRGTPGRRIGALVANQSIRGPRTRAEFRKGKGKIEGKAGGRIVVSPRGSNGMGTIGSD